MVNYSKEQYTFFTKMDSIQILLQYYKFMWIMTFYFIFVGIE